MVVKSDKYKSGSLFRYLCSKGFQNSATSSSHEQGATTKENALSVSVLDQKKPGGWKAMPFILGNETFERFATIGLLSNFMVYLMREFNMDQVSASNVIYIWSGVTNFAPLVGAFISDAYVGRFLTIGFSSVASFLGMLTITLTAWIPDLQPPKCQLEQQSHGHCIGASTAQMGVLIMGLGLLSIGTGGIRPCSIPFGIDQFDPTTEEGLKGINSFFNWYYTTFTLVILLTLTIVIYIQDQVSWVLGLGIPTILMACSIVLFLIGTRIFVHVKPQGSIFSSIAQVFVAAYKKRHLKLPEEGQECGVYYDPPLKDYVLSKLPLSYQFRFLNKAAITKENDIKPDGSFNQWRLCNVQDVEEVKCIIRIIPVWASGIISFTAMGQQGTFTLSQALKMDRHLGPKFQIPAGSMAVISMITIGIFLPIYDRIIVPSLRKITKREGGITLLQRIGIGNFFSILAMIAAGVFEQKRRDSATSHPGAEPISVFWLSPQLVLMGFCEAFNILGQIEFFNKQFPEHMRSIANSLLFCSIAGSSYLSSLVVNVVHHVTGGHGHPDWLTNDINAGKLDYFYYLLAVMSAFNFVYFLYVARRYRYKGQVQINSKSYEPDVELNSMKP
ncbi:nitrate transporter 1.7, NRT1/ PTR family 2.13 [Hibiscus trionum]|uniref:Nitrate transporter 1.7, NRT1/ PTR family 2.13 n=1 Tax=Hibiscus trionum TaxID=183268 RepID=A0A9W7HLX5_HIBTR|nr:nitrate transporter 1.7, NRT1/ PTR family 2.13 [Hibiscus trionum]